MATRNRHSKVPICGIYRIRNKLTNEMYIGQSRDIEARFKEHLYHKDSKVDKDIRELGESNFEFDVIELCDPSELDYLEDYYIQTLETVKYGYNEVRGGQHNIGESNSNCKLSEAEVYFIREEYNNHKRKYDVYESFKDKVTESYFSSIWEGVSWKNIHYDVYTPENIEYYKKGTCLGENGKFAIFTDAEVLEFRKRYVNESAKQIYESVKDRCGFQTLQQILWGRYYSHIPVYDKKNKTWINN